MEFAYNDGGRAAAGYKGDTGDCVVRAIAIATEQPYQTVYDAINALAQQERLTKRHRHRSNARSGVSRQTYEKYLLGIGWMWCATMRIGAGCTVHLKADELPSGKLIVRISKHVCAVIDGVIQDTYDPSRDEMRCVYGYFRPLALTAPPPEFDYADYQCQAVDAIVWAMSKDTNTPEPKIGPGPNASDEYRRGYLEASLGKHPLGQSADYQTGWQRWHDDHKGWRTWGTLLVLESDA